MISETINKQIAEAMKSKDEVRLSTLRMLSSELHNAKIDKRAAGPEGDLNKDDEIKVVRSEAKKRKDAIEAYKKAGAKNRAEKEEKELEILKEFLPKEMSDEELEKIVTTTIAENGVKDTKEMGRVIGAVMKKAGGKAEGGRVAEIVKTKLT